MIFILDGDPAVRDSLRCLLEAEGLEVVEFASGSEFMGTPKPAEKDCVILDANLPGMSGFEVLEQLHLGRARPPVIVATSEPNPNTTIRAYSRGAFQVLDKPFDLDTLLAAVRMAVNRPASRSSS